MPRFRAWPKTKLADKLPRHCKGVATVAVNGSLRRELSVLLHAEKLREYGDFGDARS